MNPVENLRRACELAERQVEAAMAKPTAQTACAEWNAAQLVNHLVTAQRGWADMADGKPPRNDPFGSAQVVGEDFLADYRQSSKEIVEAFAKEGALEQMFNTPAGEMPGAAAINLPTFDAYLHAWDLEQATGLALDYPDDLTEAVMAFSKMSFSGERPPFVVGPEVEAPEGATAMQRLAAFNGRSC